MKSLGRTAGKLGKKDKEDDSDLGVKLVDSPGFPDGETSDKKKKVRVINFHRKRVVSDSESVQISAPTNARHMMSLSIDLEWEGEGTFSLIEMIGKGAYGKVYRGVQGGAGGGIEVAIKSLPLSKGATEEDMKTLKREFELLREMRHENIVTTYGVSFRTGAFWIIMEYCENGSVKDMMNAAKRTLTEKEIAYFLKFVLQGLSYLHEQDIIHLDIKAGNILVTKDMKIKIADFGTAITTSSLGSREGTTIVGTPLFMSPQLCRGEPYDTKTDIWSLGVTAIQMAEGKPPMSNLHVLRAMTKIGEGEGRKTLEHPGNWSKGFNDFIAVCMKEHPTERPEAVALLAHPFIVKGFQADIDIASLVKEFSTRRKAEPVTDVPPELATRNVNISKSNLQQAPVKRKSKSQALLNNYEASLKSPRSIEHEDELDFRDTAALATEVQALCRKLKYYKEELDKERTRRRKAEARVAKYRKILGKPPLRDHDVYYSSDDYESGTQWSTTRQGREESADTDASAMLTAPSSFSFATDRGRDQVQQLCESGDGSVGGQQGTGATQKRRRERTNSAASTLTSATARDSALEVHKFFHSSGENRTLPERALGKTAGTVNECEKEEEDDDERRRRRRSSRGARGKKSRSVGGSRARTRSRTRSRSDSFQHNDTTADAIKRSKERKRTKQRARMRSPPQRTASSSSSPSEGKSPPPSLSTATARKHRKHGSMPHRSVASPYIESHRSSQGDRKSQRRRESPSSPSSSYASRRTVVGSSSGSGGPGTRGSSSATRRTSKDVLLRSASDKSLDVTADQVYRRGGRGGRHRRHHKPRSRSGQDSKHKAAAGNARHKSKGTGRRPNRRSCRDGEKDFEGEGEGAEQTATTDENGEDCSTDHCDDDGDNNSDKSEQDREESEVFVRPFGRGKMVATSWAPADKPKGQKANASSKTKAKSRSLDMVKNEGKSSSTRREAANKTMTASQRKHLSPQLRSASVRQFVEAFKAERHQKLGSTEPEEKAPDQSCSPAMARAAAAPTKAEGVANTISLWESITRENGTSSSDSERLAKSQQLKSLKPKSVKDQRSTTVPLMYNDKIDFAELARQEALYGQSASSDHEEIKRTSEPDSPYVGSSPKKSEPAPPRSAEVSGGHKKAKITRSRRRVIKSSYKVSDS